jgi:hypothetical protein
MVQSMGIIAHNFAYFKELNLQLLAKKRSIANSYLHIERISGC